MNQILNTKLEKDKKTTEKKNWFKFQFFFSIFIILALIILGGYYLYCLTKKEKFSENLIANYNIYRLYNMPNENTTTKPETSNHLFGIIQIPKINLYYPVFSYLTEELLKIAPCKFYGDRPNINGNICIAGHNYDNSLFFSKISTLSQNDEIFLFDNAGIQFTYLVSEMYEVASCDVTPVLNYDPDKKTLTLVTCNNFNSNRFILKAIQKEI